MNLDAMLEVAIGVVAAWLMLSVAVSQIQEWISSWLDWRGNDLKKIIGNMLGDPQLLQDFFKHPYIQSMVEPGKDRGPSYIQDSTFSRVMMDLIVNAKPPQPITGMNVPPEVKTAALNASFEARVNDGIAKFKQDYPVFGKMMDVHFPHLTDQLITVNDSITEAKSSLEDWYNAVQERASGWYKRRAIIVSFVIGILMAAAFNIDSIQIATQLWKAPTVRQVMVAQASATVASGSAPTNTLGQYLKPQDYTNSLVIPIGWPNPPVSNSAEWPLEALGILITGLAAAQGAPFWFNILNKLVNIRGSGNPAAPTTPSTQQQTPPASTPSQPSAPPTVPSVPATDAPVGLSISAFLARARVRALACFVA